MRLALCASKPLIPRKHGRRPLCQLAVRHLAYPGATVARVLGATTSALNRAAWSAPLPEQEAFT
jgi:hypothetical protein